MRRLKYGINVTLDGCVNHSSGKVDAELHQYWTDYLAGADGLIYGRSTFRMMEDGWRAAAETGVRPDWMEEWMVPFAKTIHAAKKYVVSDTLKEVDWYNTEIIKGADLAATVRKLKSEGGKDLTTGGVTLPLSLAKLGLIDEYEFVVHPFVAGHGPALLSGLPAPMELKLTARREFSSGAVAMRYEPVRR